jgi:hypothetical protein
MKVEQVLEAGPAPAVSSNLELELPAPAPGGDPVVYRPMVEALNAQRADPTWELRAPPGTRLSGSGLFHLVARVPKGGVCQARISVRAEILSEGMLFGYRAAGPAGRDDVAIVAI